jgi:hypothetical protein
MGAPAGEGGRERAGAIKRRNPQASQRQVFFAFDFQKNDRLISIIKSAMVATVGRRFAPYPPWM